ncbi:MAG: hypothetical protein EA399_02605 [Desulfovibrionales bacterium]|nr:MAG: hypothetical protein EA399_02605 [Desulfovibrionales bacterium]
MQTAPRPQLRVEKVHIHSLFKKPKCKEQKKFNVEAYLFIRESLKFLQRRSNWDFFNGLSV